MVKNRAFVKEVGFSMGAGEDIKAFQVTLEE
ncbi:hypothetical protein BMS3Bbin15_01830 [archaeon BMS3Bbin15]|nr:hypothetical protein BMS3Bbin15_01830 [archaeon BMS3Bbin15]